MTELNETRTFMKTDQQGSFNTPLRVDAFELSDQEKIEIIKDRFFDIMHTLGLDMRNDSLKDTPLRVAKMYVQDIFGGLNPKNKPEVTLFENKYEYNKMLLEKNITLYSNCEHHFVPIIGKVHVAYIPKEKVVGLSKINRLVQYYASRPQVQERLTNQIMNGLRNALETEDVAVFIDAMHMCVCSRGVKDTQSSTITLGTSGRFEEDSVKKEFLLLLK